MRHGGGTGHPKLETAPIMEAANQRDERGTQGQPGGECDGRTGTETGAAGGVRRQGRNQAPHVRWDRVRKQAEAGASVPVLARAYVVSEKTIRFRAKREGWKLTVRPYIRRGAPSGLTAGGGTLTAKKSADISRGNESGAKKTPAFKPSEKACVTSAAMILPPDLPARLKGFERALATALHTRLAENAGALPKIRTIREFKTALDCLHALTTPAKESPCQRPNLFAAFGGIRKASGR
jgi:hypothetical protein